MKKALVFTLAFVMLASGLFAQEVAVIVKTGNSSFWQNVQTACFDAQKDLKKLSPKFSVTFLGPQAETNINEQINIVESAIDRGVKAIVLAPSDVKALIPVVKKAKDAGIPVVIIDSRLDGATTNYISFLATDGKAAGAACAKEMIARLKAKGISSGKIAIESYVAGAGSEIDRVGGFKDYLAKNAPGLTVVSTQYCNGDQVTALNQVTNTLASNADLVGFYGANEPAAVGMGRAIAQAGLAGKLVAIGFDGNGVEAGFIKDGTLQAICVQSGYNMGFMGVKAAFDASIGKKKVASYIDTGFLIVTQDNINTQEAKNVLY